MDKVDFFLAMVPIFALLALAVPLAIAEIVQDWRDYKERRKIRKAQTRCKNIHRPDGPCIRRMDHLGLCKSPKKEKTDEDDPLW